MIRSLLQVLLTSVDQQGVVDTTNTSKTSTISVPEQAGDLLQSKSSLIPESTRYTQ